MAEQAQVVPLEQPRRFIKPREVKALVMKTTRCLEGREVQQ